MSGGPSLRREIVATLARHSLVIRGLDVFVTELEDETGAQLADICLGYVITRDAFALLPLWSEIEALPREVPSALQIEMLNAARETLVRGTRWFLAHTPRPMRMGLTIAATPPASSACSVAQGLLANQGATVSRVPSPPMPTPASTGRSPAIPGPALSARPLRHRDVARELRESAGPTPARRPTRRRMATRWARLQARSPPWALLYYALYEGLNSSGSGAGRSGTDPLALGPKLRERARVRLAMALRH
jgi:hypothetical protein